MTIQNKFRFDKKLYIDVKNILQQRKVRTITLDVFDTVLLRKIWPEQKQFYLVAQKWLPIFREISSNISVNKLLFYREFVRRELLGIENDFHKKEDLFIDVNLTSWFTGVVKVVASMSCKDLGAIECQKIVAKMIEIELATEKDNLYANSDLITTVKKIRREFPELKVYFVSDMYLTEVEICELLTYFKIDIFDGGISSSSVGKGKFDGGLFHYLDHNGHFPGFDIFTNLHIGDNQNSDVKMARLDGSNALHYWRHRNRRSATRLGEIFINRLTRKALRRDRARFRKELTLTTNTPYENWRKYGELFSQPLYSFLLHVGLAADVAPETQFLMVSSEAKMFKKFGDQLFSELFKAKNIVVADKLNRRMAIRALVYCLAKSADNQFNADAIFKVINFGEIAKGNRREIYKFFFDDGYAFSELVLNERSANDFAKAFFNDVRQASEKYLTKIRESYEYTLRIFKNISNNETVIVDVGWGGTVQALFAEFAKLHGHGAPISGLYLGCHPADRFPIDSVKMRGYLMPNVRDGSDRDLWNAVIWEYAFTNKAQFPEDAARLRAMQQGFRDGEKLFLKIEVDPKMYFEKIVKPRIRNFITKPSGLEVETIGSIGFDASFIKPHKFFIIDRSNSRLRFVARLALHPKYMTREKILFMNSWPAGIIKYYHLYGMKTFLRCLGRIKHRRYL